MDDYSRGIAKIVALQLVESDGFDAAQESAIEILSELLLRYISELCCSSHSYAELGNRTDINIMDIITAMEDMGTFMPDLQTYYNFLQERAQEQGGPLEFPLTITDYPVKRRGRFLPTFQDKQEPTPAHIPSFLPAFPDAHTYIKTPASPTHTQDPVQQTQVVHKAKKEAEEALKKLHFRLLSATSTQEDLASNPFLMIPQFAFKESESTPESSLHNVNNGRSFLSRAIFDPIFKNTMPTEDFHEERDILQTDSLGWKHGIPSMVRN